MSKTKKVIVGFLAVIVLALLGLFVYGEYFYDPLGGIAKTSLNNLSGSVKAVEGDRLRVIVRVPENFDPASIGGYKYIEKEMFFNFVKVSVIVMLKGGDKYEMITVSDIKAGDNFSAIAGENVLNKNEVVVSELIILR
jgi:hypothetical protein